MHTRHCRSALLVGLVLLVCGAAALALQLTRREAAARHPEEFPLASEVAIASLDLEILRRAGYFGFHVPLPIRHDPAAFSINGHGQGEYLVRSSFEAKKAFGETVRYRCEAVIDSRGALKSLSLVPGEVVHEPWAQEVTNLGHFQATPMSVVHRMLQLAEVDRDDVVFDLGCGDGRIVIAAAQTCHATGIGVEVDPDLVARARANARTAQVEDLVEFRLEDATRTDFSAATVVMLFLPEDAMKLLKPVLERQLAAGARVVSNSAPIPGWTPSKRETIPGEDRMQYTLYFYRRE